MGPTSPGASTVALSAICRITCSCLPWAFATRCTHAASALSPSSWFTIRLSTATPRSANPWTSRSLSANESCVAMDTTRNCVLSASVSSSRSSTAFKRWRSIAAAASSTSSFFPPSALMPKSDFAVLMAPSSLRLIPRTFCKKPSRKSGKERRRSVCPVGAVSTITRSNVPSRITSITSPSATTSSVPGGGFSRISANSSNPILEPRSPSRPPICETLRSLDLNFSSASSVSTSIAQRFPCVPSISTGSPASLTARQSPRECAGSVEIISVFSPASASCTPSALLVLVFPTPPLPPTNTNWLLLPFSNRPPYCAWRFSLKATPPRARRPYTDVTSVSNRGTSVMLSLPVCGELLMFPSVRFCSFFRRSR
mmetsp:Transcript_52153/g.124242  ORF Transcript_52153/g.124242 Transcript_52153/m.124242 type:complete len:369 (+) Transcript_52153:489-1595(+)